ncbi:MAG: SUMF1/EgtB/PvdO family nonheme iron enzyme [Spirochaetales bacterium]|nr:SUMF1/EgtB/PvdO family nonheme iron enzyme [Spirochaetales bacterium]
MAKQKSEETDFSDVSVTLKPLFGIKPEYYLPVIYIVILGLILFFVFFFPGINKNGTTITFKTIPGKAPVYVDATYVGSTPCTAFVASGERKIEIKKPFYKEIIIREKIKGGIFGTLFFPLKQTLIRKCELDDQMGLFQWAINDLAQYGMIKDFTEKYQYPPLVTDAISALYGTEKNIDDDVYSFITNAMYFTDSGQELKQVVKGFSMLASKKKVFSSYSVIRMCKDILKVQETFRGFPCWLSGALSKVKFIKEKKDPESRVQSPYNVFTNSDWFKEYFTSYKRSILKVKEQEKLSVDTKKVNVKGSAFVLVPETRYVMGDVTSSLYPEMDNLPHPVSLKPFYISITEVTNKDFFDFTRANPDWLPSNRELLTIDGLATDEYLIHWEEGSPLEEDLLKPVTNISYYAAQGYCEWLSSYLPGNLNSFKAALPSEAEWECVARFIENKINPSLFFEENQKVLTNVGRNKNDPATVQDMFGSVWEWCNNWFFPKDYPLTQNTTFIGSEKAVRGGSWANSKDDNIRSSTRGSQPPAWCTPYLGFRVVLTEK